MDYEFPESNPIASVSISYKDKERYVETGVFLVRKVKLHKLEEKIKKLSDSSIFSCKLLEIDPSEKYNNWLEHKSFPCIETDFISLFIPYEGRWASAVYIADLLQCTKFIVPKPFRDCKELFMELERETLVRLQLSQESIELPFPDTKPAREETGRPSLDDVEQDLKTVESILAKYELKLTAEQKCKFLEELVKVLG